MDGRPIRLCLFFSYGVDLAKWDAMGILDREMILYRELAKRGVKVSFFTYGAETDVLYRNRFPEIEILPAYLGRNKMRSRWRKLSSSFLLPIKFRATFRKFDVVKTNQMWGAWVPALVKKTTGARLLVRCGYELYQSVRHEKRGFFFRSFVYWMSAMAYSLADHVLFTAEQMADFATLNFGRYGISRQKISVFPNLIDTDRFCVGKEAKRADSGRILYVGRLAPEKNLFLLLRVAKSLNVGVDLVGAGPLEQELFDFAKQQNVDVQFMGAIPNSQLPRVYQSHQIFVMLSQFEGNPKSLLEAMSCGMAVLGSRVQGIRDVIQEGRNGLMADLEQDDIQEVLGRLLKDTELRNRLANEAREYVVENCSIDRIVQRELECLRKITQT